MTETWNFMLSMLFADFARAATAVSLLLSILYLIRSMRGWSKK